MTLITSSPLRSRRRVLCALGVLGALTLPAAAGASDHGLHMLVNTWSARLGADARVVAQDARLRHPRSMVASAGRFRADALHARAALAATAPASAVGRSGRRLALAAFADYATAGSRWIVSGKARVAGHRKLATTSARAASQAAAAGNALLVAAGNKLRRS